MLTQLRKYFRHCGGDSFALSHLMLIRTHEDFTGEKTEAQTGWITCPRTGAGNWNLSLEPVLLSLSSGVSSGWNVHCYHIMVKAESKNYGLENQFVFCLRKQWTSPWWLPEQLSLGSVRVLGLCSLSWFGIPSKLWILAARSGKF